MEQPTLAPLEGGWSGETFAGDVAGVRTVVRIYGGRSAARGPLAPEVDAAVLDLVRGLVPVPEVLEARRGDPGTDRPGLLVCSFEPGVRGDLVVAALDGERLRRAGHALGDVAGRLACMPMTRSGPFVDGELRLGSFGDESDLAGVVETRADRLALPGEELDGLRDLADDAAHPGGQVPRHSLVHADLNPANVLLDPRSLEVGAVLDWEYAHAGHPASDLGSLLRTDRRPAWVQGVLEGYRGWVPAAETADEAALLHRARAADLVALVDLAARRGENPVADHAHDRVRAIARTRDVHAT